MSIHQTILLTPCSQWFRKSPQEVANILLSKKCKQKHCHANSGASLPEHEAQLSHYWASAPLISLFPTPRKIIDVYVKQFRLIKLQKNAQNAKRGTGYTNSGDCLPEQEAHYSCPWAGSCFFSSLSWYLFVLLNFELNFSTKKYQKSYFYWPNEEMTYSNDGTVGKKRNPSVKFLCAYTFH